MRIYEIPNYYGYGVDKVGNVYSKWVYAGCRPKGQRGGSLPKVIGKNWNPIKVFKSGNYMQCKIRYKGKEFKSVKVHKLMAITFLGERPSKKHCVCHGDGNGYNNHIKNLRWDTYKNNEQDKVKHGIKLGGEKMLKDIKCTTCKKVFSPSCSKVKNCSVECGNISSLRTRRKLGMEWYKKFKRDPITGQYISLKT